MARLGKKTVLWACAACVVCSGCMLIGNYDKVRLLAQLAANRAETQRYVDRQERLFDRLKDDLGNGRLNTSLKRSDIAARYSEPIFCHDDPAAAADGSEYCLYRYPTRYFSTDKIYLYFDPQGQLRSWRLDATGDS